MIINDFIMEATIAFVNMKKLKLQRWTDIDSFVLEAKNLYILLLVSLFRRSTTYGLMFSHIL